MNSGENNCSNSAEGWLHAANAMSTSEMAQMAMKMMTLTLSHATPFFTFSFVIESTFVALIFIFGKSEIVNQMSSMMFPAFSWL